ncbi:hypothetical protein QIS74_13612 [Colletotrichum tabaci]|uniref:Uncharacterized protein n=1 Tax=Colletotrichum tabaci TaxID=1209068 RepID=A0AAV9SRZ8_9PEZI
MFYKDTETHAINIHGPAGFALLQLRILEKYGVEGWESHTQYQKGQAAGVVTRSRRMWNFEDIVDVELNNIL